MPRRSVWLWLLLWLSMIVAGVWLWNHSLVRNHY